MSHRAPFGRYLPHMKACKCPIHRALYSIFESFPEKSAVNVAKGKPLLENTTLKNVAEVKARVKGNN